MSGGQEVLIINNRRSTIESVVILQICHPRIFIHLGLHTSNDPVVLVSDTTRCKTAVELMQLARENLLTAWRAISRRCHNSGILLISYPHSSQQPVHEAGSVRFLSDEFFLSRDNNSRRIYH